MNLGFDRVGRVKRAQFALSLAAMLALTACGGGGGDSSSSSGGGGGGTATASATGIASKGLLANADVKAYAVNADGTPDRSKVLGSATTDASGRYTITGLPASTPVILEVTPKASGTTMYDEATGTTVSLDSNSDFSLSAAVVLDSSGQTSAQITPYTTMAVEMAKTQKAEDSSKSIADLITAANTSVSTALNVPILSAEPSFSSDNKPSNEAAVKLAAVSQLAQSDSTCGELATTLARVKCAVEKLKDEVKRERDSEDDTVIRSTLATALNSAQSAVEKDPNASITVAAVTTGTVTEAVSKSAQDTAVAAAKALIANLRSTLSAMTDEGNASSLASRAKVVGDAFDASHRPFNQSGVLGVARVLDMVTHGNNDSYKYGSQFAPDQDVGGNLVVPGALGGGCQVFTDSTFSTVDTENDYMVDAPYVQCRITYKVVIGSETAAETGIYNATAVQTIYRVERTSEGTEVGAVDRYTIKTVLVDQVGTWTEGGGFQRNTNVRPTDKVSGSTVNGTFTGWQTSVAQRTVKGVDAYDSDFYAYSDVSLVGDLAPSLSQFAWGKLPSRTEVGKSTVNAVMSQANGTAEGTTRATLQGLFTLVAKEGATVLSSFNLKEGSFVETVTETQGYVNAPTSGSGKVDLQFEATAYGGAVISGRLQASDFVDISDQGNRSVPTSAAFTGTVKESATATTALFTGSLTATLSKSESAPTAPTAPAAPSSTAGRVTASSIAKAAATSMDDYDVRTFVLDGTLVTTGSNTLHVGLTVTVNVAGEGTLNGTVTASGTNGASIKLEMTISDVVTTASYLKVEELTSGVKFNAVGTESGAPGTTSLYKNTTVVGLLDFDKAKVTYVDNTYEQF